MNEKLPYEKLIAEKMQHLHLPDKEASWQQMKKLLDEQMPTSGNSPKRPGGKWWWISSIIIILTGGIWAVINNIRVDDNSPLSQTNSAADKPSLQESKKTTTIDQTSTPTSTDNKTVTASSTTEQVNASASKNNSSVSKTANAVLNTKVPEPETANTIPAETNNSIGITSENNNSTDKTNFSRKQLTAKNENAGLKKRDNNYSVLKPGNSVSKGNYKYRNRDIVLQNNVLPGNIVGSHFNKPVKNNAKHNVLPDKSKGDDAIKIIDANNMSAEDEIVEAPVFTAASVSNAHIKNFLYDNKNIIELPDDNDSSAGLATPDYTAAIPDVRAKRKALLKEIKRKERKEERELAKSYRTYKSFWGENTNRWFAAGIAPYQNFAIASQQTYNYNSSAGRSIASDYIPSPYLQLHVTNRVYLLSEFQFNSPQATPSLLLSQKEMNVPFSGMGYTENIYLRKLYYFNLPVSFYYSPVKNFYLGSGLQFSSLSSGLAYAEQRTPGNSLIHSETFTIKDDAISSRLKNTEWRYLFDANYYADRFMFGFRYNQAFSNYVNLKVNNTLPPTQARNQSFQFYIRYNIVVSTRKH